MEQSLDENIDELYKYRMELINKINMIDREINKLESDKMKTCKHNFIGEREEGMYGEKIWKCSICGKHRDF